MDHPLLAVIAFGRLLTGLGAEHGVGDQEDGDFPLRVVVGQRMGHA